MNKESRFATIFYTSLITFGFVLVLSLINFATLGKVKQNEEIFAVRALLNAFGIGYKNDAEALKIYEERVSQFAIDDFTVYTTTVDGEERVASIFTGDALWGSIRFAMAFDKEVERIIGVDFIDQNETPGLGGRITEKWFRDQFVNKRIPEGGLTLRVGGTGDYDPESGRFDAITGATSTSKSVERIFNRAIEEMKRKLGGGQ